MKNSKIFFSSLSLLLLSILGSSISAQTDAHYWTHQFGAKGLLSNGAVIASTEDETAVFYNPGAMTSEDGFNLSLSFLTPSYSILSTENYLGAGNTIQDNNFSFAPGLGSLGFNPFGSEKVRMAITSFTRFKSNISFRGRVDNIVIGPDDQIFVGNLEFSRRMTERWFGIGTYYKFTDNFSMGLSQFMTFHGESVNFATQKELVDRIDPTRLILGWRNQLKYSFSAKAGMLTKVGVLLKIRDIKIGATVTTPSYNYLYKRASYEYDDLKHFGPDSTILVANLVKSSLQGYKTPWSFGFGMDFPFGKTHLSFSVEYFRGIDSYDIINDTDYPFGTLSPSPLENNTIVATGNRPVVNFAIGGQTQVTKKLSLIWGFRTDFNQREIKQDLQSLQYLSTTPDVFHISFGNSIEVWNSVFSYGLDYGFGKKNGDTRLVDFSDINKENLFSFFDDGSVKSSFQSINFILAYDFSLRKKKKKKDE